MGDNELRQGLYPKPPNLAEPRERQPAESFWIIKHGIKMSGMPAWGVTHDDDSIWGLVAFLQQLPTLDAEGYRALTGSGGVASSQDAQDGHGHREHGHGDDGPRAAASPPFTDASQPRAGESAEEHVHAHREAHEH